MKQMEKRGSRRGVHLDPTTFKYFHVGIFDTKFASCLYTPKTAIKQPKKKSKNVPF